jgi:hypothetical protein
MINVNVDLLVGMRRRFVDWSMINVHVDPFVSMRRRFVD